MLSPALFQWAFFFVLFAVALRWGAAPERIASGVYVGLILIDVAYHEIFGPGYEYWRIDLGHFIFNALALAVLVALALKANRFYPLWLAAFQTISVIGHATRGFVPPEFGRPYMILTIGPSYLATAALCAGIWMHVRRVRKSGPYRSWHRSSG